MELCNKCILPTNFLNIEIDDEGICNFCKESSKEENYKHNSEFKNEEDLISCLKKQRNPYRKYDVLVPMSGGVDSCNVLITIVKKYNLKALAFHNDHGYEDETATENVKKLCKKLNVDLIIMQQDIEFMKKLWKYMSEVNIDGLYSCYVCGNILYLNALEIADKFNIPIVINGYSKGQVALMGNKKEGLSLLEQLITFLRSKKDKEFLYEFLEKYKILDKRITYQNKSDLEKRIADGKILVLPFYIFNFYKTDKESLRREIESIIDWKPIENSYPKRTTNCKMVFLNTYLDVKRMGYSVYDVEYSELIRKGEITRKQAIEDLKFNGYEDTITELAKEIGVDLNNFNQNIEECKTRSDSKRNYPKSIFSEEDNFCFMSTKK